MAEIWSLNPHEHLRSMHEWNRGSVSIGGKHVASPQYFVFTAGDLGCDCRSYCWLWPEHWADWSAFLNPFQSHDRRESLKLESAPRDIFSATISQPNINFFSVFNSARWIDVDLWISIRIQSEYNFFMIGFHIKWWKIKYKLKYYSNQNRMHVLIEKNIYEIFIKHGIIVLFSIDGIWSCWLEWISMFFQEHVDAECITYFLTLYCVFLRVTW